MVHKALKGDAEVTSLVAFTQHFLSDKITGPVLLINSLFKSQFYLLLKMTLTYTKSLT
jgi:hypothetical protein